MTRPPDIDIAMNNSDTSENDNVKNEPPDTTIKCDMEYCSNCLKYKSHMDTLIKCADRFVDSVLEEGESIGKLEDLLEEDKVEEANNLLNNSIKCSKRSHFLEILTTKLIKEAKEFKFCSRKQ